MYEDFGGKEIKYLEHDSIYEIIRLDNLRNSEIVRLLDNSDTNKVEKYVQSNPKLLDNINDILRQKGFKYEVSIEYRSYRNVFMFYRYNVCNTKTEVELKDLSYKEANLVVCVAQQVLGEAMVGFATPTMKKAMDNLVNWYYEVKNEENTHPEWKEFYDEFSDKKNDIYEEDELVFEKESDKFHNKMWEFASDYVREMILQHTNMFKGE